MEGVLADILAPAHRWIGALFALGLLVVACAPSRAAGAETVVSLTFDDGIASQYDQARPQLLVHAMLGTFYINSGTVGDGSYFMTWSEVDQLRADGNEIGGHTVRHTNLDPPPDGPPGSPPPPSDEEVRSAICDDAATLRGHGYQVLDFAYPYGRGFRRSAVLEALQECGYVSARTYGLLRESWDCVSIRCPYAEAIPPPEPYRIRTPGYKSAPLSVEDLKLSVQQALDNGGGWVPLVFHEIDSSGDPASVTPGDFKAFLDWLQGSGAVVRTVRSVMGYPDLPATPEPPLPVHAFGPAALDTVAALASVNVRKRQDVDKIRVTAAMLEPGTLSARGTVSVQGAARVFRLKGGSASAAPGKRVKLRLKLKKKALRIAKRAIHKHRRVRASITITATDRAGNKKTAKRAVRLTD